MPKIKTHSGAKKRSVLPVAVRLSSSTQTKDTDLLRRITSVRESCVVQLMQMILTSRT